MNYKNAEKLKQIIQSEKQRMERDADISVPYHRPKQHTLKEFLARKTAITSSLTLERFKNMKNPMKAIKVSVDDLQLIIEKTKKRQEESEEFFSNCISDEEENDDADLKLNDHSSATDIDKIVDPTEEVSLTNEILETEEVTETEEVARIEVPTKENVCPTKEASSTESLMEVQPAETPANAEPKDILNTILDDIESIESKESSSAEADLPTHSKDDPIFKNVLSQTSTETNIQESIAEPLSTVNTNPPSNENAVVSMETNEPIQPIEDPELAILRSKYLGPDQIEEPTPKVENASTSQNFPSLQGKDNEDMIIDLETGVVKPRQLTGAEFFRKCFTSYLKKTPGLQLPVPQSTFENFKKKLVEKMQQKRIEALGKKKKDETEAQAKVDAEAEEAKKTKEGFENDAACGSEEENVDDEEEEETDEESIPEKIVYKTVDVNRFLVTDCGGDVDPNDVGLI